MPNISVSAIWRRIGGALLSWWHPDQIAPAIIADPITPPPLPAPPIVPPRRTVDPARREAAAGRRRLRADRDKVSDMVDDLLTRFQTLSTRRATAYETGQHESTLKNLLGCDFHVVHPGLDPIGGGAQEIVLDGDADDLVACQWPLDIGLITRQDAAYHVSRFVTAHPAELRGKVRIVMPNMAIIHHGDLGDSGEWWCESNPVGLAGGKWVPLNAGMQTHTTRGGGMVAFASDSAQIKEEIEVSARITTGMALTRRYSWHVALGVPEWPQGPRMLLPTSPRGCLSFFQDREIDPGRSRRAALRHWVRQHYRDASDNGLAFVREHLRGNTEFGWRGLAAEILVSAYDLEKNEMFREQADTWRAARKHNVVRVRLKKKTG